MTQFYYYITKQQCTVAWIPYDKLYSYTLLMHVYADGMSRYKYTTVLLP